MLTAELRREIRGARDAAARQAKTRPAVGITTACSSEDEHARDADGVCLWCGDGAPEVGSKVRWTRERAIAAAWTWAQEHGRLPAANHGEARRGGTGELPSCGTAAALFGSWKGYLQATINERRDAA